MSSFQYSPSVPYPHTQHSTQLVMVWSMESLCKDVSSVKFHRYMLHNYGLFPSLILNPMVVVVDVFCTIGDLVR